MIMEAPTPEVDVQNPNEGSAQQDASKKTSSYENDDVDPSRKAFIDKWVKIVKADKEHHKDAFERMKVNMAFVSGLQWDNQKQIHDNRYTTNFTNRLLAQKTATLYAKNPTAVFKRRPRLDFAIWDGKQETLVGALTQVEQALQVGAELPLQAVQLVQDWERGKQWKKDIDKVGDTLATTYQYQTDTQEPEFKPQMKQMVWRTGVCGVGYVRIGYANETKHDLTVSETRNDVKDRVKVLEGFNEDMDDVKEDSAEEEEVSVLSDSVMRDLGIEQQNDSPIKERLIFDFPPSTSIIPDRKCRSLKDFVGAHHVAQEYLLTIDFVNDFFGVDVKCSSLKRYDADGEQKAANVNDGESFVWVLDIVDRDSNVRFTICEGYPDYLVAPEAPDKIKRFWPWIPITFNHVETEEGSKASPFPPSDVDLVRSAQMEYNRVGDALREHRKANAPHYVTSKGQLSEEDKDALEAGVPNEVIELQAVAPNQDAATVLQPMKKVQLDPMLYDRKPLTEDALITTGAQEANLGPAQPNVTATAGTIAEQSRMNVSSSDVDTLDDFLSAMAQAGGELIFEYFSVDTVKATAGIGASFPLFDKEVYKNELYLQIQAASSGRPNKAVEAANWERLAPLLLQTGANPQPIIRETVKRLGEDLEPMDFYPVPGMNLLGTQPPGGSSSQPSVGPSQPLPQNPMQGGVATVGHGPQ